MGLLMKDHRTHRSEAGRGFPYLYGRTSGVYAYSPGYRSRSTPRSAARAPVCCRGPSSARRARAGGTPVPGES